MRKKSKNILRVINCSKHFDRDAENLSWVALLTMTPPEEFKNIAETIIAALGREHFVFFKNRNDCVRRLQKMSGTGKFKFMLLVAVEFDIDTVNHLYGRKDDSTLHLMHTISLNVANYLVGDARETQVNRINAYVRKIRKLADSGVNRDIQLKEASEVKDIVYPPARKDFSEFFSVEPKSCSTKTADLEVLEGLHDQIHVFNMGLFGDVSSKIKQWYIVMLIGFHAKAEQSGCDEIHAIGSQGSNIGEKDSVKYCPKNLAMRHGEWCGFFRAFTEDEHHPVYKREMTIDEYLSELAPT